MKEKKKSDPRIYRWMVKQIKPHFVRLVTIIGIDSFFSLSIVGSAIITRQIIDFAVQKQWSESVKFAILLAVVQGINVAFSYILPNKRTHLVETLKNMLQRDFLKNFFDLQWLTVKMQGSGDIQTHLTSDVMTVVDGFVVIALSIVSYGVQLGFAFIVLFQYEPTLAVLAFVIGPLAALFNKIWGRKLKKLSHDIQYAEGRYRSLLNESIENNLIVKTFQNEERNQDAIQSLQKSRYDLSMKRTRITATGTLALNVGYYSSYFVAFIWGAYQISLGRISFGTFTAFLQLVGNVQSPIETLSHTVPQILSVIASIERLMAYEDYPKEPKGDPATLPADKPLGILFSGVSWHYQANSPILRAVSVDIKPGEMIGLIGSSGEGKTTLFHLLLALMSPREGTIHLYSGSNTNIISPQTRLYFAYVPQGNSLFSGTIRENLEIAAKDASQAEMEQALRIACILDFVMQMEGGLDTVLGTNGIGISEGQAQRLCLARAILRKAPILLLDEATSALDMETEQKVLTNIKNELLNKTCIAITHRPTILSICDSVYRIENHDLKRVDS